MAILAALAAAGGVAVVALNGLSARMTPRAAGRVYAALAASALAAVVLALVLVTVGYLAAVPAVADVFHWCGGLAARWVPWWAGAGGAVALAAVGVSATRTCRRHRRARADAGSDAVVVLGLDAPVAYSVAGRPGQVVVSSGMLASLDCDERLALFAHERSHLRHRHHRYLWLADLAAAVPLLRPLRSQVRFAVERWADEDAAVEVGSRDVVARALARAALAGAEPPATLAAGGGGVPARVEALLGRSGVWGGRPGAAVIVAVGAVVASGAVSVVQLQRFVALGADLCHF